MFPCSRSNKTIEYFFSFQHQILAKRRESDIGCTPVGGYVNRIFDRISKPDKTMGTAQAETFLNVPLYFVIPRKSPMTFREISPRQRSFSSKEGGGGSAGIVRTCLGNWRG